MILVWVTVQRVLKCFLTTQWDHDQVDRRADDVAKHEVNEEEKTHQEISVDVWSLTCDSAFIVVSI